MDQEKIDKFRKEQQEAKLRKENMDALNNVSNSVKTSSEATKQQLETVTRDIAKSSDIEEVIKQLKETQLASYLSGAQKQSVILADSTDLGEAVAGLGTKLDALTKSLAEEKSDAKLIATVKEELSKVVSALNEDTDGELVSAIDGLRPLLENINVSPVVNVPESVVNVDIPKIDFKPLSSDIKEVTKAVKAIKQPTLDTSALLAATKKVSDAISGLSFPVPNYVLPFKDVEGKAAQVQLDSNGKVPIAGTISVDTTGLATATNQTGGSQKTQIVDAGGDAVTVTGGKLDVNATASLAGVALPIAGATEAVGVAIVDGSGNQITSFSGGTQYSDGDANADPTGTVSMGTDGTNIFAIHTDTAGDVQVDVLSSALPTGAATAAKQPALGTAGTSSADVITVQGRAAMTPLLTDGSATTQPVSNAGLTELAAAINSSKVDVNIVSSDVATGGTSAADDADFTAGITPGTPAMGVYESTPTTVTDGDLGTVGITAGRRLKTSATIDAALPAGTNNIGDVDILSIAAGDNNIGNVDIVTMPTVTVNAHAVTNAGTFATQVDGAALTALQLIDDTVFADDVGYTLSTSKGTVLAGVAVQTDGTDPTAVSAEADVAALRTDMQRNLIVNQTHPRFWHVSADYGAAQTNTSVKAAPGASLSLYITDLQISNGATAGNITLLDGSGGTVLYELYPAINGGAVLTLRSPIKLTANTALCITSTTVTTHSIFVSGYVAP